MREERLDAKVKCRYEAVHFDVGEEFIRRFLDLPKRLYGPRELMQNEAEERAVLTDTHCLSRYFSVQKFLVMDFKEDRAAARAVLTLYPDDSHAYIGYFESESKPEISEILFLAVKKWAREHGYTKLTGPVNASFWLGYRLKVDQFGSPYTGEPYNLPYYQELFQAAGFQVRDSYKSNRFRKIDRRFDDPKFASRLEEKQKAGYEIRSPKRAEFDSALRECYRLIIRLYSDFPIFKWIDEQAFIGNYSYLKYVIDLQMVKLAYYQGEMKGFFISVPNYENLFCGRMTFKKFIKIVRRHFLTKDYVMLYMGVDGEHHGLGKALAESIMRELKRKKACSIGALIHGDKVNGRYFGSLIEFEYHYVLMEADLTKSDQEKGMALC